MADKREGQKKDPTITSKMDGERMEGTHPARPVSEADDAANTRGTYRDNPDKPDESSNAQIEVLDDEGNRK